MTTNNVYVFNQYYLSFLKLVKKGAKHIKDKSSIARNVLKNFNVHYNSFDNSTNEHISMFNENFTNSICEEIVISDTIDTVALDDWIEKYGELTLFKNVQLKTIRRMLKKNSLLHQYMLIFHIFRDNELNEEEIKNIMEKLKGVGDKCPERHLKCVNIVCQLTIENKTGLNMKDIEETSIGKLAKDIVSEIDIDKVKESLGGNGDILSALSDPNGGIGNLINDVHAKMANKLKNGEVKKENLFKDALNMAGNLPGLGGSNSGPGAEQGAPDIGNLMKMMSSMMGVNPNNGKMRSAQKKMEQQARMKSKLNKKQKKSEQESSDTTPTPAPASAEIPSE